MEQLERFLLIASAGDDVTRAINFAELDAVAGAQRSQYLGAALQEVGGAAGSDRGGVWAGGLRVAKSEGWMLCGMA